jgi:hypothetical protein
VEDGSALVISTWILVGANALLVIATAIPAVQSLLARRAEKRLLAAEVTPELSLLLSRVDYASRKLRGGHPDDESDAEHWADDFDDLLGILAPIVERSHRVGLEFANEIFVARHLLTQAHYALLAVAHSLGANDTESVRHRLEYWSAGQRLALAAASTIERAGQLLPEWTRNIEGEPFWDRFQRVAGERENEADRILLDERQRNRRA